MNRILAFSTHPDDIELYAGGTLLKHVREGSTVSVVLMTYGDQGSILPMTPQRKEFLRRTRAEETRQRFQKIPSVELCMLGLPDMSVCRSEERIIQVLAEMVRIQPTYVYLPESTEAASSNSHPDHQGTGQIAESAASRYAGSVMLRYYHSKSPNLLVDVSAFYDENAAALKVYRSQYRWTTGYLLFFLELERYFRTRKDGKKLGTRFAESFREVKTGLKAG
jgi:LmbE family N-acetylglucosaminyl deacetylase